MTAAPPPVLVLASARSCTTVFAAMLGGHPALYAFPELNLFAADTVGGLLGLGQGGASYSASYVTGLFRAVAQLRHGAQTPAAMGEAADWVAGQAGRPAGELFAWLRAAVAPRAAIDKSPRTALTRRNLARAGAACPDARLIHLTRHPVRVVESALAAASAAFGRVEPWAAELHARTWLETQRSIGVTLGAAGGGRRAKVRSEDFLAAPGPELTRLAGWLGVAVEPDALAAMARPDLWPYAGPAPPGFGGDGDPGFQAAPHFRPGRSPLDLPVPPEWGLPPRLTAALVEEAARHGYGCGG